MNHPPVSLISLALTFVATFLLGCQPASAQKLPLCHVAPLSSGVSLTFANCYEESGKVIRGVLRGGSGYELIISSGMQMISISRVDSVDLSLQKSKESLTLSLSPTPAIGDYISLEAGAMKQLINLDQIPDWVISFLRNHSSDFLKYKNLDGYSALLKIQGEPERRAKSRQLQAEQQQKLDDESKLQRQAAAKLEIERLRPELDTLEVGQLFAKADEFISNGMYNEGRIILRLLISKFPDHSLTNLAAQQLERLPK